MEGVKLPELGRPLATDDYATIVTRLHPLLDASIAFPLLAGGLHRALWSPIGLSVFPLRRALFEALR